MREIKFRATDIESKEWVYGFICLHYKTVERDFFETDDRFPFVSQKEITIIQTPIYDLNRNRIGYKWFEVYPQTVGQFTGLLDKNGKEICEGDIVNASTFPFIFDVDDVQRDEVKNGIVEFAEGTFMVRYKWKNKPSFYQIRELEGFEIIGNIHDNPELMK